MTGRKSAFTLVELLVVITIISILAGLLLTAITMGNERAKIKATQMVMSTMASTISNVYWDGIPTVLGGFNKGSGYTSTDQFLPDSISDDLNLSEINTGNFVDSTDTDFRAFMEKKCGLEPNEQILDAWGNPLYFAIDKMHGYIYIWSKGPDGEDDDGKGPQSLTFDGNDPSCSESLKMSGNSDYDDIMFRQSM